MAAVPTEPVLQLEEVERSSQERPTTIEASRP